MADFPLSGSLATDPVSLQRFIDETNILKRRLAAFLAGLAEGTSFGTIATQNANAVALTGGTINGAVIGGSSPAAGTFSSVTATTANIDGGTIDGATIGGVAAAAGTFTSVQCTSFGIGTPAASQGAIADASTTNAITDPADSPADADALRDDIATNTVPSVETALNTLGGKVNSILAVLRTFKLIQT